jgi:hypothetical protein
MELNHNYKLTIISSMICVYDFHLYIFPIHNLLDITLEFHTKIVGTFILSRYYGVTTDEVWLGNWIY